jgi:excisionase family DNA binding protein
MRYFTADEVAEKLRVSRATIQRLLSTGDFPGSKVGSQWRISEEQLNEYLSRDTTNNGQTEAEESSQ